jgi:hypothetical protein
MIFIVLSGMPAGAAEIAGAEPMGQMIAIRHAVGKNRQLPNCPMTQ